MEHRDWFPVVIGFAGVLIGTLISGFFTMHVARENRRAEFQRQTLLAIQDQVVAYMDATFSIQVNMPESYASGSWRPPTPPLETSLDQQMMSGFMQAQVERQEAIHQLHRLGPRVMNDAIRAAVVALIEADHANEMTDANSKLFEMSMELNELIGKELRRG